ncbi:ATP-binding protein [Mammaliicoccus sciuri]|uniref:ATP-binding protein n=1 Tax=Mammaliicoccus sciuri TaxID=1296 RepID=UPI0028854C78|nr:ATP-binding protein [Mammaliicoccus sciuri]MDT0710192.1 ATP-binding protein [Mammaliicoccus sciuri]
MQAFSVSESLQEKLKAKSSPIVEKQENLYCEKCGKHYDFIKHESGYEQRFGCECQLIEAGKKEREAYKQKHINKMFNKSLVNPKIKNATFDEYEPTNKELTNAKYVTQRYANSFRLDNPQSITLQGSFGTGKSHLAMAIVNRVKEKGYTAIFMNIPKLMTMIKKTFDKDSKLKEHELKELFTKVDLVVFDDIGTAESKWVLQQLFEIIDDRQGRHNIFTTNLSDEELQKNIDYRRIFSRMNDDSFWIPMNAEDYRMRNRRKLNDANNS